MVEWFAHEYSLEMLERAPLIAPSHSYVFPKRVEEVERGALYVMVRPAAAERVSASGPEDPTDLERIIPSINAGIYPKPELPVKYKAEDIWLGIFALGYASPHTITGVFPTPHANRFLALSGGYAYFVDAGAPEQTQFLKQQPMVWIGYSVAPALLLLADHRTITAVGAEGVVWQTPPLSMEGLSELRVEGAVVIGKGWDAISDSEHEFRVEMQGEEFVVRSLPLE